MASFEKLSEKSLESVIGGVKRIINTGTSQNAVIRSGPGQNFSQIESLSNGTIVLTTGEKVSNFEDGRNWCEIYEPVHGWVASSIIGY